MLVTVDCIAYLDGLEPGCFALCGGVLLKEHAAKAGVNASTEELCTVDFGVVVAIEELCSTDLEVTAFILKLFVENLGVKVSADELYLAVF